MKYFSMIFLGTLLFSSGVQALDNPYFYFGILNPEACDDYIIRHVTGKDSESIRTRGPLNGRYNEALESFLISFAYDFFSLSLHKCKGRYENLEAEAQENFTHLKNILLEKVKHHVGAANVGNIDEYNDWVHNVLVNYLIRLYPSVREMHHGKIRGYAGLTFISLFFAGGMGTVFVSSL